MKQTFVWYLICHTAGLILSQQLADYSSRLQSLLIQDDHIPAGNAQYAFFLHGRNNAGVEALGRQGRLDNYNG
jgi:hypothetical protein